MLPVWRTGGPVSGRKEMLSDEGKSGWNRVIQVEFSPRNGREFFVKMMIGICRDEILVNPGIFEIQV